MGAIIYVFRHRDSRFTVKDKNGLILAWCGVDDRFVSNIPEDKTHNGISLGMFVIMEKFTTTTRDHEANGHCRQSRMLGPLYLPTVGLCSGVHNLVHRYKDKKNIPTKSYYDFWPERWADNLADIKR